MYFAEIVNFSEVYMPCGCYSCKVGYHLYFIYSFFLFVELLYMRFEIFAILFFVFYKNENCLSDQISASFGEMENLVNCRCLWVLYLVKWDSIWILSIASSFRWIVVFLNSTSKGGHYLDLSVSCFLSLICLNFFLDSSGFCVMKTC